MLCGKFTRKPPKSELMWRISTDSSSRRQTPRLRWRCRRLTLHAFPVKNSSRSVFKLASADVSHRWCFPLGRYLYIEASNRQAGDRARLQSAWFIKTQQLCLQFWYHMFGKDIGSLNIYILRNASGSETKVWSQQGHMGDKWIFAQVPMNRGHHEKEYQVKHTATRMWLDPAGALW